MKLFTAFTVAAFLTAPVVAAPCHDAKGKFTKCPPATAAALTGVTKDKNGKCHDPKGKFVTCPK